MWSSIVLKLRKADKYVDTQSAWFRKLSITLVGHGPGHL